MSLLEGRVPVICQQVINFDTTTLVTLTVLLNQSNLTDTRDLLAMKTVLYVFKLLGKCLHTV